MKFSSIILVAVLLVGSVSAEIDADKFKTFLRGPKVVLKQLTPTSCSADEDCNSKLAKKLMLNNR